MLPTTIRRLPAHVTDSVRSQHAIPDLPAAAAELVQNSLDAGARSIRVTANLGAWALTVEDDGGGIPGASLPLLGQRCCTSKPAAGRGEALAALALVCQQVSITTRAAGSFETHRKLLVASTAGAAAGSSSSMASTLCSVPRQRQGTTVVLSGFLHNAPVQRRALQQQQQRGAGAAAASTALLPHAAACAALELLKLVLLVLMLPHTGVELVLQQQGSSSPVLHMAQGRSLTASLQALFHHSPALHAVKTPHQQGWQLDGAVLTTPAPAAGSSSRLLYVNKAAVSCPVLAQLLKDLFGRHVKATQAAGTAAGAAGAVPGSSRHPEPSYVLLITCPAAAVTITRLHGCSQGAEFPSSSLAPLTQQLGAALGAVWGSMPPGWTAAVRHSGSNNGTDACAGSTRTASQGGRSAVCFSRGGGTAAWLPHQQPHQRNMLLPVHGLSMNSKTRSLAGMQAPPADTTAPPQPAAPQADRNWPLGDAGDCNGSDQLQQHQAAELEATASELAALLADTDTEDDGHEQVPAGGAAGNDTGRQALLCPAARGPSTKRAQPEPDLPSPVSPGWLADSGWTAGWSAFEGADAADCAAGAPPPGAHNALPGSPADMLLDSPLEPERLQLSRKARLQDSSELTPCGDAMGAQHSMDWLLCGAGAAGSPARAYHEAGAADCMASPGGTAWQQQGHEPQLDWELASPARSPVQGRRLQHDAGESIQQKEQEQHWQWWQQQGQQQEDAARPHAGLAELLAAGCSPAPGSPTAAAHGQQHHWQGRNITHADSDADAGLAFGFGQGCWPQPFADGAVWMERQEAGFAAGALPPAAAAAAALRPGFGSQGPSSRHVFGMPCGTTGALQQLLASPPVALTAAYISRGGQAGGSTGSCNSSCGDAGAGKDALNDDEAASGECGRSPAGLQQEPPAINPAAGAMSEDTVQQEAGRRQTVASSFGGRRRNSGPPLPPLQQQHTTGAEPQACSALPPSTPPRHLLPPFSERLLMSAPPAAKAVRRYARSDSVSNRAAETAPARNSGSRKRSDGAAADTSGASATAQASKRRRHTSPVVLVAPAQQSDSTAAGDAGNDDNQSCKAPTAGTSGGSKQYIQMRLPFQRLDPNCPQPAGPLKCSERAVVLPCSSKAAASKGGRCMLKPAWVDSAAGGASPHPPSPKKYSSKAGPGAARAATGPEQQQPAARAPAGRRVRFSGVNQVLGPDKGTSNTSVPADSPQQEQRMDGVAAAATATATTATAAAAAPMAPATKEPASTADGIAHSRSGYSHFFPAAAERRSTTTAPSNPLTALLGGGSAALGQPTASTPPAAILSLDELCSNSRGAAALLLMPQAVSRRQLVDGRVLGQADSKLVVTRCGPVLLAVDQHAADERLQLEALQMRLAGEQQQQQELLLQRRRLFPPHSVSLGMQEARALALYGEAVSAWGWQVVTPGQHQPAVAGLGSGVSKETPPGAAAAGHQLGGGINSRGDDGSGAALVGAASTVLLQQVPVLAGVQLGAVDLQLYLHQLLETSGACSAQPPPGVLRVLRSKACRGAIMFGDALSARECEDLVVRLAAAELPFMCAHGRPTTMPLVDLQQLASRLAQRSQLIMDCARSGSNGSRRHQLPLHVQLRRLLHRAT